MTAPPASERTAGAGTAATRYAVVVVTDGHGRVLLLRRAPGRPGGGQWGLPGGHLEANEDARTAALRELAEEVGAGARIELGSAAATVASRFAGRPAEVTVFPARWLGGDITLDDEHTASTWVAPGDAGRYPLVPGVHEDLALLGLLPAEQPTP